MDVCIAIVLSVLIIHLFIVLIYKLYCKDPKPNDIKNYPDYIIGGEYIFEFVSDNPFEENIRTTAKILDLKENHKGETYVEYIIVDIPKKIQTKSIDDFAYYYKPI